MDSKHRGKEAVNDKHNKIVPLWTVRDIYRLLSKSNQVSKLHSKVNSYKWLSLIKQLKIQVNAQKEVGQNLNRKK